MEQKSSKEKNEKEKQNELNEILKKNEFFIAQQKLSEEEIQKLKKESEDKKEQIKTKTNPELFNLVISELKDYLKRLVFKIIIQGGINICPRLSPFSLIHFLESHF